MACLESAGIDGRIMGNNFDPSQHQEEAANIDELVAHPKSKVLQGTPDMFSLVGCEVHAKSSGPSSRNSTSFQARTTPGSNNSPRRTKVQEPGFSPIVASNSVPASVMMQPQTHRPSHQTYRSDIQQQTSIIQ
jgi:hypothetical protein